MEFATKKGLRVLEMFKQFDRDGSGSISRGEFVEGIKVGMVIGYLVKNTKKGKKTTTKLLETRKLG